MITPAEQHTKAQKQHTQTSPAHTERSFCKQLGLSVSEEAFCVALKVDINFHNVR